MVNDYLVVRTTNVFQQEHIFFFFTVEVLIISKILTMQYCQSNTQSINILWKIDCQFRMELHWWLHGRPAWIHPVIKKMCPLKHFPANWRKTEPEKIETVAEKTVFSFSLLAGGLRKL